MNCIWTLKATYTQATVGRETSEKSWRHTQVHTHILISQHVIHIRIWTINTLKPCNMHTALERDGRVRLGKVMVAKAWRCEQWECCKSKHSRVCSDKTQRKRKHDERWTILYQRDPSHTYSPGLKCPVFKSLKSHATHVNMIDGLHKYPYTTALKQWF